MDFLRVFLLTILNCLAPIISVIQEYSLADLYLSLSKNGLIISNYRNNKQAFNKQ